MTEKKSPVEGFRHLTVGERITMISSMTGLTQEEERLLSNTGGLPVEIAEHIIENVFSTIEIPLGLATNFLINGKDFLIPMAVEEASVVAACSNAAKIARASGGFTAWSTEPLMIGQIQLTDIEDLDAATVALQQNREKILEAANEKSTTLRSLGAGAKEILVRRVDGLDRQLILHLLVDVREAMGANIVNTMCEHVSPIIEEITGGEVILRILSNLSDRRMAYSSAVFPSRLIGGEDVARRIIKAYEFARFDPYRAATHNKGIMNGIDAVLLATYNDWRAVEAGAHSFAASTGRYSSLTRFSLNPDGDILGEISIPLAVGTVGGATKSIPKAVVTRKILNVKDSREFAQVLASVGLAQNFAAVRALSAEGIQMGHMSLHSKNIAISAGARGEEIDQISKTMILEKNISISRASELLKTLRGKH